MASKIAVYPKVYEDPNEGGIMKKYLNYCEAQMPVRSQWYLITLMVLAGGVIPIGLAVMSLFPEYINYVGLSMTLFLANVIVNVAGVHTKVTLSLFLATAALLLLIPAVAALGLLFA